MTEETAGPAPEETPPAPEPMPAETPSAAPETPPQPEWLPPAAEAVPPAYAPPPEYAPPAGYAVPPAMAATPPRRRGPVLTAAIIVAVLVIAGVGYGVAGYAFASSRMDSVTTSYNAVVTHENTLTTEFNAMIGNLTAVKFTSGGLAGYKTNHATFVQLVTQSTAAQPIIAGDDNSLASAQTSLTDNSWLTVLSKSSLDKWSTRIQHWRNALADAKTTTGDLILFGNFFQAYDDALVDLDSVDAKAQIPDFAGMASAIGTLKTDSAKAIQLAGAPGVPADMKSLVTDLQSLAADLGQLVNDALAGDQTAVQADAAKGDADGAKVDAYDFAKINSAINTFYQPLIDGFNSEVNKANNT